jgi:hypothetical protein
MPLPERALPEKYHLSKNNKATKLVGKGVYEFLYNGKQF